MSTFFIYASLRLFGIMVKLETKERTITMRNKIRSGALGKDTVDYFGYIGKARATTPIKVQWLNS